MFLEKFLVISLDDLDVEVFSFGLNNGLGCNEYSLINEELVPFSFMKVIRHVERLATSTGLIEEGGVTDLQSSELLDNGLVIEKRFKSSLGNFSLVRSVRGVPKFSKLLTSWDSQARF